MFIIWKIIKRVIAIILGIAIAVPTFTAYRIWSVGNSAQPVKSDLIVVLGAAEYNGTASDILAARLKEANDIFRAGFGKSILTVGANQSGDVTTEAAVGKKWLIDRGLLPKLITALPDGQDTLSSTKAYVSYMKAHQERSVLIVTDKFHCLRALTMARDLGVTANCAPALTGPAGKSVNSVKYLLRETFAYLSYLTFGRIGVQLSDQIKK
jgi:vancomycin permeability regulator SanA